MTRPHLPPSLQVIERGWLSSNNILFFEGNGDSAGATLIDSGYAGQAAQTLALLKSAAVTRQGDFSIGQLINTHSHSDHIGGNAALKQAYGCAIVIPDGMADVIETWNEDALLLSAAGQSGARFLHDATLHADVELELGGLNWRTIAAPGHDMHALIFHCAEQRLLISGDALWHDGFGVVFGELMGNSDALPAARRTLEQIARLPVDVVIPGHGKPFDDVDAALQRAFRRLEAFESDRTRLARNALRACFTFNLLDLQRLRADTLADYLAGIPFFVSARGQMEAPDAAQSNEAFADWLLGDLLRARAVAIEDGWIVPRMAA